ncbi:phospholipase [Nocardioides mangrovicus]|uniref:Phospholipase n=1 Tax=Nocardioides mangrovicus TaxID=2478913 RepID=A0A3L8P539_9ACTN|nr:phospholipase D-like domain-containing protein [Nocardioides mangrovicus]RLV49498.1 phospholipase [Nocardioides mangrovicus]
MTDPAAWFLSASERGNPSTRLDDRHPDDQAWSVGNRVRPLVHGATYFAELYERLQATREGDLVLFTDWQGDADERLTGEPGSEVAEVLASADERGVDVRGLIWRSHWERLGFTAGENRRLGAELQSRGAEALLDMRVRTGGSHHQKFVVIRHRDDPSRDIAFVGGIDLCHSRRDDADHHGDPQALEMASEYGDTPPWHDIQAAIEGPAVHDVETVFRERWLDPTPLSSNPISWTQDHLLRLDREPDPLPEQHPPPPAVEGGTHSVQLLRTYPDLRVGLDYEFADGGERSVARGYSKALTRAQGLVYVEDQYLWGHRVGDVFTQALRREPELRVIVVVPLHPDKAGSSRAPQLLGRRRAMLDMLRAAPGRVAFYGIENHAGTPVYVHAKTCNVDDQWVTIGSDNFNRRSWTHDSELSAAIVDTEGELPRRLRLTLAAEHLDREVDEDSLLETMADCESPAGMFRAYRDAAAALDAWHDGGQVGERPPGRLRRMRPPELSRRQRLFALPQYLLIHDPDGRPRRLKIRRRF